MKELEEQGLFRICHLWLALEEHAARWVSAKGILLRKYSETWYKYTATPGRWCVGVVGARIMIGLVFVAY